MEITLHVNSQPRTVTVDDAVSLLRVLRDQLGLTGAKDACEQGECGACSVILDGRLVCSCLTMAAAVDGAQVTTVEGLADADGTLHPVQQALVDHGAVQCGYCTPGVAVAAAHLLDAQPHATPDEIREALAGNLCRCTGYGAILRAVEAAAQEAAT